jgi:hypothetical protein
MSIGNLQDYGNKGNNFPWQLKMLQGLDAILSALSGGGSFLAPQTRVTNMLRSTTTGTITAGKYSASFANMSATVNATVKGITIKPGEVVNFDAGTLNNTLDAIAYDGTGSDLLIIYIS